MRSADGGSDRELEKIALIAIMRMVKSRRMR
jgi:hypothetical protein